MQQPNSFRLYACFYALLCLLHLHQQHQVCSLTIIIDGATTSEWATRDEYQRLVKEQQADELSNPINYPDLNSNPKQLELSGGSVDAALDQLDLIELQQQQQHQRRRQHQHQHQPGARTLGDLVAHGDQLEADGPIRERDFSLGDSAPHNYCGTQLVDILEVICNGRYYTGQPEVVQPTVKSRRSSAPSSADAFYQRLAPVEQQPQHQQGRRKQRTAIESPSATEGEPAVPSTGARNKHSKMSLYRRVRQVVNECCRQPCTFKSLEQYCMVGAN